MASAIPNCQSNTFSKNTHFQIHYKNPRNQKNQSNFMAFSVNPNTQIHFHPKSLQDHSSLSAGSLNPTSPIRDFRKNRLVFYVKPVISIFGKSLVMGSGSHGRDPLRTVTVSATTTEKPKKRYPGEAKGFVEEMRFVAMKLHTRDQSKEGEKEADSQPVGRWEPTIEGYLRFLVDSKLVYDSLERIVHKAAFPSYAAFRNTGLERSQNLAKDLDWFKQHGHAIPEPSSPGIAYASYLEELSEKDPQAFICHFYNIYFAHTAGGRMIGKKVSEKILDNKELEFYKWDGNLSELLQNVKEKLNKVAERGEGPLLGGNREILQILGSDPPFDLIMMCEAHHENSSEILMLNPKSMECMGPSSVPDTRSRKKKKGKKVWF